MLHDHLREAIVKTMEDPDSPWSEVTTRGASPTPVAIMVLIPLACRYLIPLACQAKAKAKAYGKGPRPRQAKQASPVGKARVPVRT